jgi:uncharacterized repeat protein (TIGR02543 family)
MKRTLSLLLVLLICLALVPARQALARTTISNVTATWNMNQNTIRYGQPIPTPTDSDFTVTSGTPARFATTMGGWLKYDDAEGKWKSVDNTRIPTFREGQWKYSTQLRVDDPAYVFPTYPTVKVNGVEWTCSTFEDYGDHGYGYVTSPVYVIEEAAPITGTVSIVGNFAYVDERITINTSKVNTTNPSFNYQWQSCTNNDWKDIKGATAGSFIPTEEYEGLSVRVKLTHNFYSSALFSNAIKVSGKRYSITVENGTAVLGSQNAVTKATAGTSIFLHAAAAPDGQTFENWSVSGVTVADEFSANTSFVMPAGEVTARAVFKNAIPTAQVTIKAPAVSEKPSYEPSVPANVNYTAYGYTSGDYKNNVYWYDVTAGKSMTPDVSTFVQDHVYRVAVFLTPKNGYTFAGTASGTVNQKSAVLSSDNHYELCLEYTFPALSAKTYTVTLNPNGGTCSKSSITVTYGKAYGTLPTPTRTGYTFAGWWTAKDTGGKEVTATTVCYASGNYTLYARWKAGQTYTVTLNPNGGTCGTSIKTVTYGQAYGTMPVPKRTGYTFAGWWTAKDSGGKKVTASTICYASGNYTLYARWTEGYTMTFDPNGGTVSPTTKVVKYGQQYGTLPTPTRAGYTFTGWWTAKADGGKKVVSTTVCYASAGYTLYARWTPRKFVITLDPNGGECATKTKTVTYGQAYGTMPVPSTRTGYTFAGWYTAKTGGKKVTASTVCYASGNYTLYARWTPKTYTVTLNPNGGTCSTTSKKVTYGQTYGTLPTPTRSGYTFAGWWTKKDTGGKQVFSSTTCYATGNYTLYARWTKN